MKTYILLFRGINVGGKNRLPMKDLIPLLENSGCSEVKTYIQSGNVVLKGEKKPDKNIELEIESKFGFKPDIVVLEKKEFEDAVKLNPFNSNEGKEIHFYFAKEVPTPDLDKLESVASKSENFKVYGNVLYLYAPEGIGRSKLVAGMEKSMGVPITGRNLNTINKILEILKTK